MYTNTTKYVLQLSSTFYQNPTNLQRVEGDGETGLCACALEVVVYSYMVEE